MSSIIIAFPAGRSALSHKIRDALFTYGFTDVTVVVSGSEALREINLRENGILISCVNLTDMFYRDLICHLPECFSLLLVDTGFNISTLRESDVVALAIPFRASDLIDTVRMMEAAVVNRYRDLRRSRPNVRSEEDAKDINDAKLILMGRNHMTEPEAYRYIQKTSMDTGRSMPETARMIKLFADKYL